MNFKFIISAFLLCVSISASAFASDTSALLSHGIEDPYNCIGRSLEQIKNKKHRAIISSKAQKIAKDQGWSALYCSFFIDTLAKVHFSKLNEILDSIKRFSAGGKWTLYDYQCLISFLQTFPSGHFNQIGDALQGLTSSAEELILILESLRTLPKSQQSGFLKSAADLSVKDPQKFKANFKDLESMIIFYALALSSGEGKEQKVLFNHWKSILTSKNKKKAEAFADFIVRQSLRFGLSENHELFQAALTTGNSLNNRDENNRYVLYGKLRNKRNQTVAWEKLKAIRGEFEGSRWVLNPKKLAEFSASMERDLGSVPPLKSADWAALTRDFETVLKDNISLRENAIGILGKGGTLFYPEAALDTLTNDFVQLDPVDPVFHFHVLMNSSVQHLPGSKLKCVVNWFKNRPDSERKWLDLTYFLVASNTCSTAQDSVIDSWYRLLPNQARLRSKTGTSFDRNSDEFPALVALSQAVQSAVSMRFSPEHVFMKKASDVEEGKEIEEVAHQIHWIRGLIGPHVGLSEDLRFDFYINHVAKSVRDKSLQEVMKLYYEHMALKHFLPHVKIEFDRFLDEDLKDKSKEHPLYYGLTKILGDGKLKESLDFDEESGKTALTLKGVAHLMTHVGILDEEKNPLP